MKRFTRILSATVVGLSMMAGVASAATTNCSLVNTGPGSNNTCTVTNTTDLSISCTNSVDVVSVNGQSANSGSVTLTGNTSGGFSYSGNAVNTNSTTNKLDVSCGPVVAVTPTTTTTPAATSTPAATPTATPAPAAKVASLPNTGSDTVLNDTLTGAAIIGVALAVSQLGIMAYRRSALK
jgi:hypothetical protein